MCLCMYLMLLTSGDAIVSDETIFPLPAEARAPRGVSVSFFVDVDVDVEDPRDAGSNAKVKPGRELESKVSSANNALDI